MNIKIEIRDNRLHVFAPYHPDFPEKARNLGGLYNGLNHSWVFDMRDEARVRAMLLAFFGTDGDTAPPTCTVRIDMDTYKHYYGKEFWLFGRLVAIRHSRDSDVRLGQGVIVLEGGFAPSSGSRANPDLGPKAGTVLEVRDVYTTLLPTAALVPGLTVMEEKE